MEDLRNMPHNQLRKAMALKSAINNLESLQSRYRPIFDEDPDVVSLLQTMRTEYDRLMSAVGSREDAMSILEDIFKE